MLKDGVVIHFTEIMVYRENMNAVRIWRLGITALLGSVEEEEKPEKSYHG